MRRDDRLFWKWTWRRLKDIFGCLKLLGGDTSRRCMMVLQDETTACVSEAKVTQKL